LGRGFFPPLYLLERIVDMKNTETFHFALKGQMKTHIIKGYKYAFYHNTGTDVSKSLLDGKIIAELESLNIVRFVSQPAVTEESSEESAPKKSSKKKSSKKK